MAKQLNVNVAVTADTSAAKAQLQQLQTTLSQLTSNSASLKVGLNTAELQKATTEIDKLSIQLKNATNINTGTLDFSKLNASIKASGTTLTEYGNQLLKLGPKGQQAFTQLTNAIAKSEMPMNRLKGLLGEFGTVIGNTIKWQAASSAIHGMMGSIQHAFSYAQQLNESLNRIQIVTQSSNEHMAKFAEQANKAAQRLSTTTTQYTNASLIYYQQGLSDKEVAARTETTIKMANASGQSAQKVSDQMTAIWNNFADGATNLEYYADVITALGAATASSSEEIATGLQKFAAVADTVGLSYEHATAALATITATTRQSADTVGTGLRTLFSRLQSLQLGETLDDGVTLTKYSKALEKIGVDVLDYSGNLRSADDILMDMGEKWQALSSAQKTAVSQTVGGVRQYATIMALMDNFDTYQKNIKIAESSEGTVQAQADIYAKSWEAAQKRVKAASEALYDDLIDDQFFISLNNGFASILQSLDAFIDRLGGLKGLLPMLATVFTGMFSNKISSGLVKLGSGLKSIMPGAVSRDRQARDNFLNNASQQMLGIRDTSQMTANQKIQMDWAKTELNNQRLYAANQGRMSADQRGLAQLAMDRYSNLRQSYQNTEQKLNQSRFNQAEARGSMIGNRFYDGSSYGDWDEQTQARFRAMASAQLAANPNFDISQWMQNGVFHEQDYLKAFNNSHAAEQFEEDILNQTKANSVLKALANGDILNREAFNKAMSDKGIQLSQDIVDTLFDVTTGEIAQDMPSQVQAALAKGNQAISDTAKQFGTLWGFDPKDVQKYAKAIEDAGDNEEELNKIREQLQQTGEEAGEALQAEDSGLAFANSIEKTVQVTTGAITTFQSFASVAEVVNENIENGGDIFDNFGAMLPGIISGLTGLASIASVAGAPLAIIVGLLAVLAQTSWGQEKLSQLKDLFDSRTDNEKELDRLKESADTVGTALEEAQQRVTDFLSAKNAHNDLLDKINDLTEGTAEFRQAVRAADQQVKQMIETYEGLSWEDVERGENGALQFKQGVEDQLYDSLTAQAEHVEDAKEYLELYAIPAQGIKTAVDNANLSVSGGQFAYEGINDLQFQLHDIGAKYNLLTGYEGGTKWASIADVINDFQQQTEYANLEDYFIARGGKTNNAAWKNFKNTVTGTTKNGGLGAESLEDYVNSAVTDYEQEVRDRLDLGVQDYFDTIGFDLLQDTEKDYDLARFVANFMKSNENFDKIDFGKAIENKVKGLTANGEEETVNTLKEYYGQGFIEDLETANTTEERTQIINDWAQAWATHEIALDEATKQYTQAEKAQKQLEKEIIKASGDKDKNTLAKLTQGQQDQLFKTVQEQLDAYANGNEYGLTFLQKSYYQKQLDDWQKSREDFVSELTDLIIGEDLSDEEISQINERMTNFINNLTDVTTEDLVDIKSITSQVKDLFKDTEDFDIEHIFTDMFDGTKINDSMRSAWRQVDFSSKVSSLFSFKDLKENLNDKELSSYFDTLYQTLFNQLEGKQGILSEILNEDEVQQNLKGLKKEFTKTGKISQDSVKDIIDSCKDLKTALDNGLVSTGALGDAFELYSSGAVNSVDKITNELWAALEVANELQTVLSQGFDYIDEFNPDRSVSDISEAYVKWGKEFKQAIEDGLTGDNRTYQIAEFLGNEFFANQLRNFFFGQETGFADQPGTRTANFEAQYDAYMNMLDAMGKEGNFNPWWDFILNGNGNELYGMGKNRYGKEATASDALKGLGFSMGQNGDVELAVEQGMTSKDYVRGIMLATGMGEDAASAIFSEIVGHSEGISGLLQANEFMAGLKEAQAGTDEDFENFIKAQANNVNLEELKNALELLGYDLGENSKTADILDIVEEVQEQAKKEQDALNEAFSSQYAEGKSQEKLEQDRADAVKAIIDSHKLTAENGELDFTSNKDTLTSMGLTGNEAIEGLANYIDKVKGTKDAVTELSGTYIDANGKVREFTAELDKIEGENTEEKLKNFNKQLEEMSADTSTANKSFAKDFFQGIIEAINELDPAELDGKIQPIIQLINDLATAFAQLDGSKESITALGNAMTGLVALGGISSNGGSADLVQTIGDVIVKLQDFNGTDLNINISVLPDPSVAEIDHLTDDFRDMQGMSKIEISIKVVDDASVQQFKGDKHGLEEAFNALQQAAQISIKLVGLDELSDQIQKAVDAINESNPTINVSLSANGQKKKEEEKPVEYPEGKELRTGANVVRRIGDSNSYIIDGEQYNLDGTAIAKEFTSMFNNLFAAQTVLNSPDHSQQSEEQAVNAILEYSKTFAGLISDIKSGSQGKSESQASTETSSAKENSVNLIGKVTELDVSAVENQSIKVKASINSESSESSSQVTPEINTDEVTQEAAQVATTISSADITMEIGATGEEAKAEGDQTASYINSLKASISVGTNTSVDEANQKIHSLDNTTITLNVTVNASALGAAVRAAAAGTSAVRAMAFHKMKCTHSDCSGTCGEQFTQCANGVTAGSICHWNNNGVGSSGATGGRVKSYVNGSPNNYVSPGPALTGEEGAEIVWNKQQGYAYIVGANHPQFVNLQPGDRIFNANDTRKILNYDRPKSNYVSSIMDPSLAEGGLVHSYANLPSISSTVGTYIASSMKQSGATGERNRYTASAYNGNGGSGGGNGGGGDGPTTEEEKPWKPERYHLITRQIKDLTALYEELSKAKEHAYGVNILKAIDKEIDAKEKLLNKNRELLAQAEDYLDEDRGTLDALGIPTDFDENGNLANYDELQEMYKKVLDTTDDEEQKKAAEEAWNAITQYEETLDKIQETKAEITDTIYELSDLALERVTTKAEIRVDFDEREIKFIQHFIDKMDDDITKTSQVLDKVTQQMGLINDKINTTRTAIDEVFASMTNSKGEKINVTYDQWLKMTDAEREALDINGDYGKQLEEYSDDILEYIEALEEYKTRGVEELSAAFDELNEKVTSQIDLFSHYNSLLSSLKDLADLQGLKLPDSYRQAVNKLNQSMVQVTKNNIQAQQGYYAELQDEANKLQQKINETNDFDLKKAYQEQLDDMQSMMRDTAEDILSLWQEGLQKARDIFDQEMDFLKQDYEAGFSDLYNTADLLQGAYDRKKELNEQYVDDYEKYYQLGKLQRQINKDLDQAAVNGNKQNKNLKALLEEIQRLQKDGSELSAYDLDILAKKYEYEKALADLEDARNAKQIVRLQRDRNGNWGYVYTAADGDELAEQEQAVEDKLYEYTKAATEQSKDLQSQILSLWAEAGNKIAEMRAAGVSDDVIDDYIADTQAKLDFLMSQLEKTGTDVSLALPKWIAITNDSFNLTTDTFTETILSLVTGMETIVETSDTISNSILKIAQASKEAADAYNNSVASLNQLAQGNGMDFMKNAQAWADTIAAASYKNVENTKTAITEMSSLYDQILDKAKAFEREFMKTYEPIIERNEKFLQDLISSLSELNKNFHPLPTPAPAPVQEQPKQEEAPWWRYGGSSMMFMGGDKARYGPVGFDTGGFTGTWGPDGRLAFLHEKENVFDQDDTVNLLKAANILKTLDTQTGIFEKGLGSFINPNVKDNSQTFEQNVNITAEFPNATSHSEIEEAFDNLVNRATQYANRKVG